VIDGAKRLEAAIGSDGKKASGAGLGGLTQEKAEKRRFQGRHVAGDDEIPFGLLQREGSDDAGQGPKATLLIREDRPGEVGIAIGRADDGGRTGCSLHLAAGLLDQSAAGEREQRFVATHAGAVAAGQNKARGISHMTMLARASGGARKGYARMEEIAA